MAQGFSSSLRDKIINVAGAGFSGLTTAYFLTKRNFKVRVTEKSDHPGGLIKSLRTDHGLVESAANGLLSSARAEAMCADIGVPLLTTRREGRKRFIYRGGPKQVPLGIGELLALSARMATQAASLQPRPMETISDWGRRVLGRGATDYFLVPALDGIYAGDPNRLSASLIFGRAKLPPHLATTKPARGKLRGTVAPPDGMQQLIDGLYKYLKQSGVDFIFNQRVPVTANEPTILCLSGRAAGDSLGEVAPELSAALRSIEMLSLATVTCFYPKDRAAKLNGFGCLFPRAQGFRARGVLFNDSIFEGRGPAHAETWIFGGALDPEVVESENDQFAQLIATDRERFYGVDDEPLAVHVTRWPRALPHYSIDLEKMLTTLPAPPVNIDLVGNYLGRIGLAKILERAATVADKFGGSL